MLLDVHELTSVTSRSAVHALERIKTDQSTTKHGQCELSIRGVGSSLKLGEQKGGLLRRAREREPITGVWGRAHSGGPGGRAPGGRSGELFAPPPEADAL